MDAVTNVPAPVNEPVRHYQPGSHERAVLETKIKQFAGEQADLSMTVGGRSRMGGGELADVVQPHNHRHVLGRLGNATDEDVADLPVTRIDHAEADAMARSLGGRLPRSVEWEWMAAGPELRVHPWGDEPWRPALANLRDSGYGRPVAVGFQQGRRRCRPVEKPRRVTRASRLCSRPKRSSGPGSRRRRLEACRRAPR